MPVFKGPNNKSSTINWKSSNNQNQSSIFATEFTSETKRTAIYLLAESFLGLGGERELVAYQDPGKPIILTEKGKNYDLGLQKVITTDPNFKRMVSDQTRYHVTTGLTVLNEDGSIGSRPSTIEVNRILGTTNPPVPPRQVPPGQVPPEASPSGPAPTEPSLSGDPEPEQSTDLQLTSISEENLNDFKNVKPGKYTSRSGNNVFRYPLTQSKESTFDYLKIDVFEYVKSSLMSKDQNSSLALARPSQRLGNSLVTVILPMQPNISDSNGVSWNEDQLNAIQGAFASVAYGSIGRAGQIQDFPDFMNWLKSTGGNLSSVLGSLANDPGMSSLIAGYFAGQAVGTNVIGRATGAVINNNLELLFHGPKLRTFRYSYKFTPRDRDEAEEVRSIIKLFKREMAPSLSDTGLFLQTPNVFKLKYIYNGDRGETGNQHPYLNLIKPCALTNFSVNYTPDGTYMTYANGGSMTSYQVDMEFSELEPIYKNDYDPEISSQTPGMGY